MLFMENRHNATMIMSCPCLPGTWGIICLCASNDSFKILTMAGLVRSSTLVGHSQTTLTSFWLFWPPTSFTDNFYLINVDKKLTFMDYLSTYLMYSKASRYTASSCTDLDNARFWIRSKKNWVRNLRSTNFLDEQILIIFLFSSMIFPLFCAKYIVECIQDRIQEC